MKIELTSAIEKYLEEVKELYHNAFPEEEKKPFSMILEKEQAGNVEILAAVAGEEFTGEAITARHEDMVLLDYFAMHPKSRGMGNGSQALKRLQERYHKQRFFLEIERTGVEAANKKQRERRKRFYLSNGMRLMDYCVEVRGVEMEVLTCNCHIGFEEYCSLYRNVYGKEIEKQIRQITETIL